MRVLHIGLVSHFTDKMLYQDNILPEQNVLAGHEAIYISDTYAYLNGVLTEVPECDVLLDSGVRLIRIKYDWIINGFVTRKIQKAHKLRHYLDTIAPDAILYHGTCGYELIDVSAYVSKRNIPFYIDSHENFLNTAQTPISKFCYKYIHGFFVKCAVPVADKLLYIGYPEKKYLIDMYGISEDQLEFFPLGGLPMDYDKQLFYRRSLIANMGFPDNVIICAHSGKMDAGKKTLEILHAFSEIKDNRLRLLIFGSIPGEMQPILSPLIKNDDRVCFLGWKNADEQHAILGAADLYLQPGTYSATAQIALCDGCALLVNNDYHEAMGNSVFYAEDKDAIFSILRNILLNHELLADMKQKGYTLAMQKFDYAKLAKRYLL